MVNETTNQLFVRNVITKVIKKFVELEGVEPSSAQGNHVLSTCLFQTSFSCYGKTWTTNRSLIL